ncbi:unnamed protein product [Nezara viridula]|uniref:Myosin motor domain-containing protein n=1 Tax=Nezara viridula TaxID=85310 RepID=A0A9P0MHA8_NEZVI|nr:unnamed protein product [Nezara viridula]
MRVTLKGDYIWIEPISGREFDVAIGARVISAEGKRILIKDDDGKGGGITCEGRDDAAEFADIRSAMKVLLFTDNEIWDILTLLAALLHTGNINYRAAVIDNLDATEIPDHSNVARVAGLLGVPKQPLIDALTRKTLFAHGETVGTDQTMLAKLHKTHGSHRNYLKPKSDINTSFGLNHFAGIVFYDTRVTVVRVTFEWFRAEENKIMGTDIFVTYGACKLRI